MNAINLLFSPLQTLPHLCFIPGMDTMLPILIAEDNEDDIQLVHLALKKSGLTNPVHVCRDGAEVIDYLQGNKPYADRQQYPFPRLLILDLKMPKLNGLEVLRWVRDHPYCAVIPTIILSTSVLKSDIQEAYELGANAYISKPAEFAKLPLIFKDLFAFWGHCQLPDIPG
jgi:CheY-like chemotaxis protein